MANKQLKLIYALKNGEIVNVSDVEKGLKCECVCPACGESLVAKKGNKVMHHFAHYAGHNCEYGYESSLHLAAKEILSNAKKIIIPAVYLVFPESYKKEELISESKEIKIDKVVLEKRYNDIVPDIVIYAGGKQFFVEIFVTHKIDDEKLTKLRSANISTIEIDLSKKSETVTTTELTDILLNDSSEKRWKYNAFAEYWLQKFYEVSDNRRLVRRGLATQVDNCPIKSRVWKGKSYANFIDDCLYCEYCISAEDDDIILCSGRHRISTIKDFSIPEEQRIKESDYVLQDIREMSVHAGNCPYCGHRIVKRHGPYGEFWGCSNYPHCDFKVPCVPETGAPDY